MKQKKNSKLVDDSEFKVGTFIKIVIGILIVLVCFALLTKFITRDKTKNNSSNNDIQYTNIIAGSIFNRKEEKYYVLVAGKSVLENYDSLVNNYTSKDEHLRVYKVDLEDPFNSNFISFETVIDNDITKLQFAGAAILYLENGIIKDYALDANVESYLNELSA